MSLLWISGSECAPGLSLQERNDRKAIPARLPNWRGESPLKGSDMILSLAMVLTNAPQPAEGRALRASLGRAALRSLTGMNAGGLLPLLAAAIAGCID
jgi:hypothetical protein